VGKSPCIYTARIAHETLSPRRACAQVPVQTRAKLNQPVINVTFDSRGYVGTSERLREPVMALSLDGLRRRVVALLMLKGPVKLRGIRRAMMI
jgi:hypothetical protein